MLRSLGIAAHFGKVQMKVLFQMDIREAIEKSYLTDGLTSDQIGMIASLAEERQCKDLEEVVREGDESCSIFIVIEGKLRVTNIDGKPITWLQNNEVVGETALLESTPRSASVFSVGNSRLAEINGTALSHMMDQHPEMGLILLRNVGTNLFRRLKSANVQIERLINIF